MAAAGVGVGDPLVVACSNGPDSLALADALIALRPGLVTLCYVDHGLRPEAAGEAEAVKSLGVPAVVVRVEVKRRGGGLEDAARRARYAALDEVAAGRWVVLGHTRSDQAETVLARLLRGAGAAGLAGIAPVRGRYVRPLLDVSRADVLAYVAARGLAPSEDAMNRDPAFLRARVRHQLLPSLRAENPAIEIALARAARSMRELSQALDWMAARVPAVVTDEECRFPVAELAQVPPAVGKRALILRAQALGAALEACHLDTLMALASGPARGTRAIDLPGLKARREYGELVLGGGKVVASSVVIAETGPPRGPYAVRTWEPGDRMRPASLRGRSRKLQDLYVDRKIAAPRRRLAVVVTRVQDGEIVWAEHIGPAHDAGVDVFLNTP